jgi:hypothetical protein
MLKIAEPTIVPRLISPSVMNVDTQLMHNSGDEVAIVINVADANSCFILSSEKIFFHLLRHAKKIKISDCNTLTKDLN